LLHCKGKLKVLAYNIEITNYEEEKVACNRNQT
jgi:hypothetical protein